MIRRYWWVLLLLAAGIAVGAVLGWHWLAGAGASVVAVAGARRQIRQVRRDGAARREAEAARAEELAAEADAVREAQAARDTIDEVADAFRRRRAEREGRR